MVETYMIEMCLVEIFVYISLIWDALVVNQLRVCIISCSTLSRSGLGLKSLVAWLSCSLTDFPVKSSPFYLIKSFKMLQKYLV